MTESADPPAERIKLVGGIADLLARRHSPGGHWKSLDDVQPNELVDIIVDDAVAIADLIKAELGRLRTTLTETQAERDRAKDRENRMQRQLAQVRSDNFRSMQVEIETLEAALATTQAELARSREAGIRMVTEACEQRDAARAKLTAITNLADEWTLKAELEGDNANDIGRGLALAAERLRALLGTSG